MSKRKPRGLRPQAWFITRTVRLPMRGLARSRIFNVEVINREAVPAKGAAILASNHLGLADPPYIWGACRRNVVAIAMAKLWRIPVLRLLLKRTGQIPVQRGDRTSGRRALDAGISVLQHGGLVLIFPEGKCSETGELLPFKPGVTELAFATGAPIIPVGIVGSNDVWPLHTKVWRIRPRKKVTLRFGEQIDPQNPEWFGDPELSPEQKLLGAIYDAILALTVPEPDSDATASVS